MKPALGRSSAGFLFKLCLSPVQPKDKTMFKHISARNNNCELEFKHVNVLLGANGSGKSSYSKKLGKALPAINPFMLKVVEQCDSTII
jgi:energy-coupling factor transporter ATP-binding protein EcfA2